MSSTTADTRSGMERNMRLLPWWWVMRWFWFGEGIWVIYLIQERGLTLGQVLIFEAVFGAIIISGEVPTGMIADRFGRRISLIIASALIAAGMLVFGLASSIPLLLLSYVVLGVADTFMSGADNAMLFDTMRRVDRDHEFAGFVGRLSAMQSIMIAALTVAGGFIAGATSLAVPLVLSGLLSVPAIGLAWLMTDPPHEGERPSFLDTGRRALRRVGAQRGMWAAILVFTVVGLSIMTMAITLQPLVLSYGVPLSTLGLFAGAQMATGALGAWSAGAAGRRLGLRRMFSSMLVLTALALLGGASGVIWLFPVFILPSIAWNVLNPHVTDYLARRTPDSERATVLSMMNFAAGLANVIVALVLASIIDGLGLRTTLAVAALAFAVAGLVVYLLWVTSGDTDIEPRKAVTAETPEGASAPEPGSGAGADR